MKEVHLRIHMKSGLYHDVKFGISSAAEFTQIVNIIYKQLEEHSYLVFDRYSKNYNFRTRIAIFSDNIAAIEEI